MKRLLTIIAALFYVFAIHSISQPEANALPLNTWEQHFSRSIKILGVSIPSPVAIEHHFALMPEIIERVPHYEGQVVYLYVDPSIESKVPWVEIFMTADNIWNNNIDIERV